MRSEGFYDPGHKRPAPVPAEADEVPISRAGVNWLVVIPLALVVPTAAAAMGVALYAANGGFRTTESASAAKKEQPKEPPPAESAPIAQPSQDELRRAEEARLAEAARQAEQERLAREADERRRQEEARQAAMAEQQRLAARQNPGTVPLKDLANFPEDYMGKCVKLESAWLHGGLTRHASMECFGVSVSSKDGKDVSGFFFSRGKKSLTFITSEAFGRQLDLAFEANKVYGTNLYCEITKVGGAPVGRIYKVETLSVADKVLKTYEDR